MRPKAGTLVSPNTVGRRAMPRTRRPATSSRRKTANRQQQTAKLPRILIVEDDFLVALQAEAALTDAGFSSVGIAISAEEAIKLAASQQPALVLMDIRLAGKRDGIEAALELLEKHGIRCIFATAHSDPETRRRAESAHPLGWLQKPYTMVSLIEMVRRGLSDPN